LFWGTNIRQREDLSKQRANFILSEKEKVCPASECLSLQALDLALIYSNGRDASHIVVN
jgi:hypothetical protein